ncbi:transposase [Streptomyces sp. NBC_01257]|uniref:transposase n=1 Tax=Streptomyces sp. NBC_01257 TaxID=2903799 RepID=UPI003FA34659
MRPRATLTDQQQEKLLEVGIACPDVTRACDLARAFTDLVRNRRGTFVLEWIRQAEQDAKKPMNGFADFPRQDLDAVTAGITHTWSSGVFEGHVNRVKTFKQAMYGRASCTLLRTRILTQPWHSTSLTPLELSQPSRHLTDSGRLSDPGAMLCRHGHRTVLEPDRPSSRQRRRLHGCR